MYFGPVMPVALLILPVVDPQVAFNQYLHALSEIPADEIGGTPPGYNVEKVSGRLALQLFSHLAVDGRPETAHRNVVLRVARFRVSHKSSHQNNLIHKTPPVPPDRGDYWLSPACLKPTGLERGGCPEAFRQSSPGIIPC